MMLIAIGWIVFLLFIGGLLLDRTLSGLITRNFDEQLEYMLTAMVASAEIGPDGEVFFSRPLGDQRFLEPNSGLYWQITGEGHEDFPSRSLWDRTLEVRSTDHMEPLVWDNRQFAGEPLRMMQRPIILPGSETMWWFTVAASRSDLDAQIARFRSILAYSFAVLGTGLIVMAALQTWLGLSPLRGIRRAIQRIRVTGENRVTEPLPLEVQPMVEELNALLSHSERQAEEARAHAGNLAHALKTPLTVLTNAATAHAPDLELLVQREAAVMRRQVDHHLARARAVGRRATGLARSDVREAAEAVERAVGQLHPDVRFDIDTARESTRDPIVALERQDLDEILGNCIENAAKYGGGSVFVTVDAEPADTASCVVWVEDDGMGIPPEDRSRIFDRGARLDTGKPGTGLGLAIVRDVVEIYGGSVALGESEDLGGLLVELRLPRAATENGGTIAGTATTR
ncbi:sensor histidine kinase [Croceicoccus naphthovorans]|uniref:histidine kinase n=1 Tax=Croceicoccus naphthovorans TaxID=1348774 RepID=A0A0G3XJ44_9SPHN|nr:HAMP domain-containing sensor histidine kinase [Croceicoccus naphthovorans]AKM10631.1 histidine kinase [Croceicoccus naphthovorans]